MENMSLKTNLKPYLTNEEQRLYYLNAIKKAEDNHNIDLANHYRAMLNLVIKQEKEGESEFMKFMLYGTPPSSKGKSK